MVDSPVFAVELVAVAITKVFHSRNARLKNYERRESLKDVRNFKKRRERRGSTFVAVVGGGELAVVVAVGKGELAVFASFVVLGGASVVGKDRLPVALEKLSFVALSFVALEKLSFVALSFVVLVKLSFVVLEKLSFVVLSFAVLEKLSFVVL